MTTTRPRWGSTVAVLAASVCLALAGCGDDTSDDVSDDTGAPTNPGETTPPAPTALAIGESTTVPVQDSDGVVELTITSVDQGSPVDLKGLEGTPFYVRMTATVVSGDAHPFDPLVTVEAMAGTEQVAALSSPARVAQCEWAYFPSAPQPGTTIDPCITVVVAPGQDPVDRIRYQLNGTSETIAVWS